MLTAPSGKVLADTDGRFIYLQGWIGTSTPAKCRSVPAGKFLADERPKRWRYPLDMRTCRALRAAFGDKLAVSNALADWAKEAIAAEQAVEVVKRAGVAELRVVPRVAPEVAAAMATRSYQTVGAHFGASIGSFLLADQPGLGKTLQTIGAIVEAQDGVFGKHLILCPKVAVTLVWGPELRKWYPAAKVFELTGTRAQREKALLEAADAMHAGVADVFVIGNIEMARISPITGPEWRELFEPRWDTVVVDESHRALVRSKTKQKQADGSSKRMETQTRVGMDRLGKAARRRIALSGTPMRGKPFQLWGTLNWLRPDLFTSFWNWTGLYYNITSNGFSDYVIDSIMRDGADRMARDLGNLMLRRTKSEVAADLPAKTYPGWHLIDGDPDSPFGIWLDPCPAQQRIERDIAKDAKIVSKRGEVLVDGHLAERTRLKQLAGSALEAVGFDDDAKVVPVLPSPKFDWLLETLDELGIGPDGEADARIVVASQFTSLLNLFARELGSLGVATHVLTGETPDKARVAMAEDFQSDDPSARVFLLNTKAGGVAITLDMADYLVVLDSTENPDDQEQVEDRVHRISRIHNVTVYYPRLLGSIEEEIAWVTAARADVQEWLLDGSRGVAAAKQLYESRKRAA